MRCRLSTGPTAMVDLRSLRCAPGFSLPPPLRGYSRALRQRRAARTIACVDEISHGNAKHASEREERFKRRVAASTFQLGEDSQRERLGGHLLQGHSGRPTCTAHVGADPTTEGADIHAATSRQLASEIHATKRKEGLAARFRRREHQAKRAEARA